MYAHATVQQQERWLLERGEIWLLPEGGVVSCNSAEQHFNAKVNVTLAVTAMGFGGNGCSIVSRSPYRGTAGKAYGCGLPVAKVPS